MFKLEKIISISQIGRFDAYNSTGQGGDLKDITLIYGPNGSGKSTITWLLRSLQSGSSLWINQRKRIPAKMGTSSSIKIRVKEAENNKIITYGDTGWSCGAQPDIRIFDTTFIHNNLHSGETVNKEQRESLFQMLSVDEESRSKFEKILELEKRVEKLLAREREVTKEIEIKVSQHLRQKKINQKGKNLFPRHMKDAGYKAKLEKFGILPHALELEALIIEKLEKPEKIGVDKRSFDLTVATEMARYQSPVNDYLSKFGATFRISDIEATNFSQKIGLELNMP